jgi:cytochrome c oxidase cbb3-type subunit 3
MSNETRHSSEHRAGPRILDHSYDGIQEYDNPTPGWWHMIFIASVLFAFLYILIVHFNPDVPSIMDQLAQAETEFTAKQFKKVGKLELNEDTLLNAMGKPDWLSIGRSVFRRNCISCHGDKGQGLVGPNMTDDYYKNVKTLMDIPRVVQDGAAAQAMPSWRSQLNQNEIVLVSAYIASLRGQEIDGPRPPEGEKIAPWPPVRHDATTAPDKAASPQNATATGH